MNLYEYVGGMATGAVDPEGLQLIRNRLYNARNQTLASIHTDLITNHGYGISYSSFVKQVSNAHPGIDVKGAHAGLIRWSDAPPPPPPKQPSTQPATQPISDVPANEIGPCPWNLCDKWYLSITSITGGGAKAALVLAGGDLRASDDCCMSLGNYKHHYTYQGLGGGGGAKFSGTWSSTVSEVEIRTKCLAWKDWIGLGRITVAGVALIGGYGWLWATTPHSYTSHHGWVV